MFTSLANDLGHQHYCWLLYNGDTSPHIPMPYHAILMVSHGFPLKNDHYQQHSKTQNHNLEVSSNGASPKLRVSILSHGHDLNDLGVPPKFRKPQTKPHHIFQWNPSRFRVSINSGGVSHRSASSWQIADQLLFTSRDHHQSHCRATLVVEVHALHRALSGRWRWRGRPAMRPRWWT